MSNLKLNINQKIEVIEGDKTYKSLIMDVSNDRIKINVPMHGLDYLLVEKGKMLEINTYAGDGKCFSFKVDVEDKGKEGSIPCYTLSAPYNIKKIQRRNFFRVDVYENIQVKNITGFENADFSDIPYVETLMIDLSAGGVRIKTTQPLKEMDIVLIKMNIKNVEFRLKGRVVRTQRMAERQRICGIEFLDITQSQSDKIIEELFQILRKQRAVL